MRGDMLVVHRQPAGSRLIALPENEPKLPALNRIIWGRGESSFWETRRIRVIIG